MVNNILTNLSDCSLRVKIYLVNLVFNIRVWMQKIILQIIVDF